MNVTLPLPLSPDQPRLRPTQTTSASKSLPAGKSCSRDCRSWTERIRTQVKASTNRGSNGPTNIGPSCHERERLAARRAAITPTISA